MTVYLGRNYITGEYVTYRVNPVTGVEETHYAIDVVGLDSKEQRFIFDTGTVTTVGYLSDTGYYTDIVSGNKRVRYCHQSDQYCEVGQTVKAGEFIGREGSTGLSTGSHLHIVIWIDGERVNPAPYISVENIEGTVYPQNDVVYGSVTPVPTPVPDATGENLKYKILKPVDKQISSKLLDEGAILYKTTNGGFWVFMPTESVLAKSFGTQEKSPQFEDVMKNATAGSVIGAFDGSHVVTTVGGEKQLKILTPKKDKPYSSQLVAEGSLLFKDKNLTYVFMSHESIMAKAYTDDTLSKVFEDIKGNMPNNSMLLRVDKK